MAYLRTFDRQLTAAIRGLPTSVRPFMAGLTFVGDPLVVAMVGFTGFVSAIQHQQPAVQRAFVYSAIAFLLNTALKLLLHRARPHGLIIKNFGIPSYSFPSGHAFGSIIFYGQFANLDLQYLAHPLNILLASVLWIVIFLIGVSRVYLSAHYPTDVMAGWILGVLSLVVVNTLAY